MNNFYFFSKNKASKITEAGKSYIQSTKDELKESFPNYNFEYLEDQLSNSINESIIRRMRYLALNNSSRIGEASFIPYDIPHEIKGKQIFNEIDPYGEEIWEENDIKHSGPKCPKCGSRDIQCGTGWYSCNNCIEIW